MRIGQAVTYIDAKGDKHAAVVVDIVGLDKKSRRKLLDLEYMKGSELKIAQSVPNHMDLEPDGQNCWLLKGERRRTVAKPATT